MSMYQQMLSEHGRKGLAADNENNVDHQLCQRTGEKQTEWKERKRVKKGGEREEREAGEKDDRREKGG